MAAAQDQVALSLLLDQLDPGEAEAIVLAGECSAGLLLVDEKRGRRIAIERGLEVTGLLGVLAEAKARGLIVACKPIVDGGSANYLVGVETRDAQIDVAYPYLKFEEAKPWPKRIAAALNENRLLPEILLPHATREPARDTRWRLKVLAWGGIFLLASFAGDGV